MDKVIIVALDYAKKEQAFTLLHQLDPATCRVKVGKEMFTRFGPNFIREIQQLKFELFLDLKFHDIPHTVANAVSAAADLGVWMVNIHASGGKEMLLAAKEALIPYGENRPLLTGVTVLTSMTQSDLQQSGIAVSLPQQVKNLALLSADAGLDGVVCSAKEVEMLRSTLSSEFKLITPGIRPVGTKQDDQKRVVTPKEALQMGSDYLVIGRPITQAKNPLKMLASIQAELF